MEIILSSEFKPYRKGYLFVTAHLEPGVTDKIERIAYSWGAKVTVASEVKAASLREIDKYIDSKENL